jgi:hypothetical protein
MDEPLPLARAKKRLQRQQAPPPSPAQLSHRQRMKAAAQARRLEVRREAARLAKLAQATPMEQRQPKIGQRASPDLVMGLAAAGVSKGRIAQALHVHPHTVSRALTAVPGSRERILQLREELKATKLTRAHAIEGRLWDRLELEVDRGEAKDVDAITRSLLASEKIQAAAAGEAHASGSSEPVAPMDLTVLVQALLSAPGA